jgi:peroxiredoxin Q/BCP
LRSFQSRLPEFDRRGIRVVAISVDSPEANRDHRQKLGVSFPLLSDEKREVVRRYDLLHRKGGPDGTDISRPAELLLDPGGIVRWANFTESVTARARPGQVLEAFDASVK